MKSDIVPTKDVTKWWLVDDKKQVPKYRALVYSGKSENSFKKWDLRLVYCV